jgi:hypothetical protein
LASPSPLITKLVSLNRGALRENKLMTADAVEPNLSGPDAGEVGDLFLVRPLGRKLPVQKARRHVRNLAIQPGMEA